MEQSHRSAGHGASRAKESRCTCRSHCTQLNPSTGLYEGEGCVIPRSTRTRHLKDDKLRDLQSRARNLVARFRDSRPAPRTETSSTPLPDIPAAASPPQNPNRLFGWIDITRKEVIFLAEQPVTSSKEPLVFQNDPLSSGPFIWPASVAIVIPNAGVHALRTAPRANSAFLATEHRMCELAAIIPTLGQTHMQELDDLLDEIHSCLARICHEKELQWAQQRLPLQTTKSAVVNTEIHFYPRGPGNAVARTASLVSLVMENIYFTTRRALRVQLAGLRDLLRATGSQDAGSIPVEPRSLASQFRLDPFTHQFILCPECYCLYPHAPGAPSEAQAAIMNCTYKSTPNSDPCDAPLWKTRDTGGGRTLSAPIVKYLHQDIKYWTGRLLSRKGLEEIVDKYPQLSPPDPDAPLEDIWSSKVFLSLKDASGKPFFPPLDGEGRLIFSLSVDSFNPFHMKTAKQTVSSTGIWLVLLNLPPHLRYLPENMCLVGVLPDKPSLEEMNHALQLVVNEFLDFWDPGVFFTRTYKHRSGKLFRAMLLPLVADMIAARQVIGFPIATTAHYFCNSCDLDYHDIEVLDREEWPSKDSNHIRRVAMGWRDAATKADRNKIFKAFGVRWSALFDLPYWDPVLFTVVDSMHALDLNLIKNHLRELFQIDAERPGGDGSLATPRAPRNKRVSSDKDFKHLENCIALIHENEPGMLYRILQFPRTVLYTICVDNDIKGDHNKFVVGTPWVLAQNIFHWRCRETYSGINAGRDSSLGEVPVQDSPASAPGGQSDTATESDEEDDPTELDDEDGSPEPAELPKKKGVNQATARRLIRYLTSEDPTEAAKLDGQATAPILRYICDLIGLDHSGLTNRRSLRDAIEKSVEDPVQLEKLLAFVSRGTRRRVPGRAILGEEIMTAVWADMGQTQLPSWISPAPRNWGTAKRGKLSADQLRVIFTIHLPITLIRLWSQGSARERKMLVHFMDLVSAVRIANMRVASSNQIKAYNFYISRYVSDIQSLYPDSHLLPSHHAALHIGDGMELFGPVHPRSTPFFERYINFLHRVNTNQKLGELESTMMRASGRCANLRAALADDSDIRREVQGMVEAMAKIDGEDIRGFRRANMLDPTLSDQPLDIKLQPYELPEDDHKALSELLQRGSTAADLQLPTKALSTVEISINGVCYGIFNSPKFRDSTVLFRSHASQEVRAGTIETIFRYTHRDKGQHMETFYITLLEHPPYTATAPGLADPYREFPLSGGFLCEVHANQKHVLHISQVISHCAMTKMQGDYEGFIHVMPLDRRMVSFDHEPEDSVEP